MFEKAKVLAIALALAPALLFAQDYVPEELEGWQRWVIGDRDWLECPFYFDRGARDEGDFVCSWPGRLELDVTASGAGFAQEWTVYADDQWVGLPGGTDHWPDRVTANGRSIEVIARGRTPSVRLAPGNWRIEGRFAWDERPGVLSLPERTGLISLTVDDRDIERPEVNRNGVYLGERRAETRAADALGVEVYRLVADDVPTRLVTHLEIDVSGGVREEAVGPLLPQGFVPLGLQSPLPARVEADGRLHLQVRPGRWVIELVARGPAVLDEITSPAPGANLPDTEVWSYASNDRLRVTAVEGLPPVDPVQAGVPSAWQAMPAFRVASGDSFSITERSRGKVSASNDLALQRTLWLDFDGSGFLVRDLIQGEMQAEWRLDMAPPYGLLAAREGGDSLLVTAGPDAGETGVEVRRTDVDRDALGRAATRADMPVTGWDTRFTRVEAQLNVPPGHKLLAAPGADRAPGSWVDRWALLDFFVVLVITIAAWRLFGPAAGIVALLALGLSFHELLAPTWLWLNLLVAIAILRVTPAGRLFQAARAYQLLSAAALVIALVPFIASQVRTAIFPQLEPQVDLYGLVERAAADAMQPEPAPPPEREDKFMSEGANVARSLAVQADAVEEIVVQATAQTRESFSRYAPNAIVQAGPGVPSWRWNTYRLQWSGPVDADQDMRLVILPRWLVSILRFVAVGLVLVLAGIFVAEITGRRWPLSRGSAVGRAAATGMAALAAGGLLLGVSPPATAQMPDAELLRELEQRLLAPPDCVPRCAEIAAAEVDVGADTIAMELSVHALEPVALPLPGSPQGWRPAAISIGDGGNARVLRDDSGTLWVYVRPGRHSIALRGPLPSVDSIEIPFRTPPRVVTVESDGWMVGGVKDRRLLSGSLQLSRLQSGDGTGDTARWESSRFPPYARVERTLEMDLDWRVRTTVQRVAPAQGALTLDVPLLPGETVVTEDLRVQDGRVLVSMEPRQQSVTWVSNLPMESPLTLSAAAGSPWTEVWRVVAGNIWHVDFVGVPESNTGIHANAVRVAEFDPRAGEQLVITATRPEGIAGATLAFDAVALAVAHGNRSSDVKLTLEYRSTRGAQHVIRLGDGAEVTSVVVDGRELVLRPEGNALTLPILPGQHTIDVAWREPGGMGLRTETPYVDLGAPAGNIDLSMAKPADRWLLATRGPQLGPAVLYWTELVVLVLFAVILGRTGLSPLSFRHWLLLGLGFSTFSWSALALVAAWLLACGARERFGVEKLDWWQFDAVQVAIAGLTVLALLAIVSVLPQGLLGTPDMHVTGYQSHANLLRWFADRSDGVLPQATAFTVPMWIYKVIILAWALWLSFALVRWMPWVWRCFSRDGYWRARGTA